MLASITHLLAHGLTVFSFSQGTKIPYAIATEHDVLPAQGIQFDDC
jgi:hypothetical protein